jgi:hypothetical protein
MATGFYPTKTMPEKSPFFPYPLDNGKRYLQTARKKSFFFSFPA